MFGTLGQFCTEDVDECQLQPNACHNGGTCFNTDGGHSCVCVNGWTGESCSENIDDCQTAVCFHGATCHDRVASFYCACPMGKTGSWLLPCKMYHFCVFLLCSEDVWHSLEGLGNVVKRIERVDRILGFHEWSVFLE